MVLLIIDEEYSRFLWLNLSAQYSSIQKQEMIVFCKERRVGVSQAHHLEKCATFTTMSYNFEFEVEAQSVKS